jgi:hypothetical protein
MAKTLKNRQVWIAATAAGGTTPEAQNTDLDLAGFEALDWTQVKNIGSVGESGPSTNLPTYDEMDTDVIQKSKGITDAGSPPIEMSYNPTDAGQTAMRAASLSSNNFAFKFVDDDGVIYYNRGLVTGPTHPNGRNEDFRLDVYTLGLNQREVVDTGI